MSYSPLPLSRVSWMGLQYVRNLSKLDLFPPDELVLKQKYWVLGFSNLLQCHYIKFKFL